MLSLETSDGDHKHISLVQPFTVQWVIYGTFRENFDSKI